MVERHLNILKNHSFFLFGARGTGKTYLLERELPQEKCLSINLLDPDEELKFSLEPGELSKRIESLSEQITHVFIDEIQKVPKLLDLVHLHIEKTKLVFALTGSSARKLKRGGANLLAGRAFVYQLYPFTAAELGSDFDLTSALEWGTLPKLLELPLAEEKELFLKTYVNTYLKEEIAEEQLVRKLDPFRRFLQVAAQTSGQIVNFSKIGKDVGASTKTVQSYFQILEDTLLGHFLPVFHESVRKRQKQNPKFYLFDYGVKRGLERSLQVKIQASSYSFGVAFEHLIVNEIIKLNSYLRKDYELSYLRTHDDAEIDLIIERPGLPRALIEIKSTDHVRESDLKHLISLGRDISKSESFCFSRDPNPKIIQKINCLPWQQGLRETGLS